MLRAEGYSAARLGQVAGLHAGRLARSVIPDAHKAFSRVGGPGRIHAWVLRAESRGRFFPVARVDATLVTEVMERTRPCPPFTPAFHGSEWPEGSCRRASSSSGWVQP